MSKHGNVQIEKKTCYGKMEHTEFPEIFSAFMSNGKPVAATSQGVGTTITRGATGVLDTPG